MKSSRSRQSDKRRATLATMILIILIVIGDLVIGFGSSRASSPGETQFVQKGQSFCQIIIGAGSCSGTVTFPKTFLSQPNITYGILTNLGSMSTLAGMGVFIDSPTPTTWANFPVGAAELLGNNQHRFFFDNGVTNLGPFHGNVRFAVLCTGGSAGAAAQLRLQFSIDGSTWILDQILLVDAATDCPVGISTYLISDFNAVSSAALFRVIGQGGTGAGDSISFTKIYVLLYNGPFACNVNTSAVSLTGFSYTMSCSGVVSGSNQNLNFMWTAVSCLPAADSC